MRASVDALAKAEAEAGRRWLSARLPCAEMLMLDRQGFVSYARLPSGARCAKLRFRQADGRQRVVYLGVDVALAAQVAAHLAERQAATRWRRSSKRLHRRGRRLLRSIKSRIATHLESDHWHFHGRQLRRKRRCAFEGAALPSTNLTKGVPMQEDHPADPLRQPQSPNEFEFFGALSGSRYDAMRCWANCQASPFDVAIGHAAADLFDLSAELADLLKAELRENRNVLKESDGVAENMSYYLQLQRHAERFIKLAPLRELRTPPAKNRPVDTYAPKPQAEPNDDPVPQPHSDIDF
ncbi:MAG: hypothetical protein C0485_19615 [Pirellula sp.]|nr:hypothetical protein [Pirellula sp.]